MAKYRTHKQRSRLSNTPANLLSNKSPKKGSSIKRKFKLDEAKRSIIPRSTSSSAASALDSEVVTFSVTRDGCSGYLCHYVGPGRSHLARGGILKSVRIQLVR